MFEPALIPGMIEPVEQQLLAELAASDAVRDKGLIVEFGCFFGRSTACLVNGAESWAKGRDAPVVHAYDSFGCAAEGGFSRAVLHFARTAGVLDLVERTGDRISFLPIFRRFVGQAETAGLLKVHVGELRDATFDGRPIALMHVDAPKFYEELKYILFRFFPHLTPGGVVVLQDYFYHWSATLVAAAQLLVEAGILRFERSAASAMAARVLRTPSVQELAELDLKMSAAAVPDLLDRSVAGLGDVQIDRQERFVARLRLAKMQHLWARGEFAAAEATLQAMIKAGGNQFPPGAFADFGELLRDGFDIRRITEADH